MAVTTTVSLTANVSHTKVIDLGVGTLPLIYAPSLIMSDGVAAGQADQLASDTRTLTSGSSETLDLSGGLVDIYGNALTFARIKVIIIKAASTNLSAINVGPNSTNGWSTMFGDASDRVKIRPGGLFVMACTEATGYPVTAATGDLLFIGNDGSLGPITFDLVLIGCSV